MIFHCPSGSCSEENSVKVAPTTDGSVRRCRKCDCYFHHPARSQEMLAQLHNHPAYFQHPYFKARRSLGAKWRRDGYRRIIAFATADIERAGVRVLDVGCDTGALLEVARDDFGFEIAGLDVSEEAAAVCRDKGIEVLVGDVTTVAIEETYDLIVLNDVLEHVADPAGLIARLATCLAPGGRVFISTPNARAPVYRVGGWLGTLFGRNIITDKVFIRYHEWLFSPDSLAAMAVRSGLDVIRHKKVEFPLREFGHGFFLRLSMAGAILVHRLCNQPTNQFLVAEMPKDRASMGTILPADARPSIPSTRADRVTAANEPNSTEGHG